MNQEVLFSESQKFQQWWLYLIMALATLLVIGAFISLLLAKLETQIKNDGIYVRYYPYKSTYRHYKWEQLSKVYVRKYSALGEYGGWGLKGFGDDKVWNVSGNMGIQLVLKDGKKLLIGTKLPEECKRILIESGRYIE
jgi:hypothetical protein